MRISKNIKKAIVISFSFFLLLGCINKEAKVKGDILVKVNYLSFTISTYSPVTTSTIETMSMKSIYLTDKEVGNIYSILKKVSPAPIFTDGTVRLKIAIPNKKDIYIEETGVVLNGEEVEKINIEGLKKLEKIFNIDLNSKMASKLKIKGYGDNDILPPHTHVLRGYEYKNR